MKVLHTIRNHAFFVVNSVGVGREWMERYGDNPEADRRLLKVNGLGASEVGLKLFFLN